jgi:hypothetical protein
MCERASSDVRLLYSRNSLRLLRNSRIFSRLCSVALCLSHHGRPAYNSRRCSHKHTNDSNTTTAHSTPQAQPYPQRASARPLSPLGLMPKAIDKRPTKLGVARVDSSTEGLRTNAGNEALGSVDAIDEHFGRHHDLLVMFVQL